MYARVGLKGGGRMKPLEEIFFRACVNEQKRKLHSSNRELSIRTIGNIFERLGFSYKQLMYYVRKWSDRGFYDYGVILDFGWFEFDKLTGEYKRIYDSMKLSMHSSMKVVYLILRIATMVHGQRMRKWLIGLQFKPRKSFLRSIK